MKTNDISKQLNMQTRGHPNMEMYIRISKQEWNASMISSDVALFKYFMVFQTSNYEKTENGEDCCVVIMPESEESIAQITGLINFFQSKLGRNKTEKFFKDVWRKICRFIKYGAV